MPDPQLHVIYYEGDDDRVVLQELQRADLLPKNLQIAKLESTKGGKDKMVGYVAAMVAFQTARSAIALRDIDDLQPQQVGSWFSKTLTRELAQSRPPASVVPQQSNNERILHFDVAAGKHTGHTAVVCVGLPDESEFIKQWGLEEFALDDYMLRLACDRGIYEAVSEFEGVSYDLAIKKLAETRKLLIDNGIQVIQAKRLLHLLRGITGFRASPATFASRLIRNALQTIGKEKLGDRFHPLIGDLRDAVASLDAR